LYNVFQVPTGGLKGDPVFPSPFLFVLGVDALGKVFQSACHTGRELDLQDVTDFVAGSQQTVKILLVVGSRNTETGARADEWGRRISNNDDGNLSSKHLVTECRELGGVVEHDRNDRRVIVAIDNKAKTLKSKTKVTRIEGNALKTLLTLTRTQLASNEFQGSQNLHEHTRSRSFAILSSSVGALELVDDMLLGCDVTTVGTKRFRQSSHENINFGGVNAKIVANTTTARAKSTDRVSLVNEKIELVFVLQSKNTGEITHGTLHRVETFDDDQNLLPRTVGAGLTLGNSFANNTFQIGHIIVLEALNNGTRKTSTNTDGGVVEFIGNDQTTLGDKGGERARVCDVTHRENHRSGLANKFGNLTLDLKSKIGSTSSTTGATEADSVLLDAGLHSIGTRTFRLGKTKIVVRTHVESLSVGAGILISAVEVIGLAVHQCDESSGDASGGTSETIIKAHLETSDIEIVEIAVESCIAVAGFEGAIVPGVSETLAKEVADMTKNDQDKVADVSGENEIVRRLILDRSLERLSMRLAGVSMTRVEERAKLSIGTLLTVDLLSRLRLKEGGR
jgi:hypothetical protein